MKNNSMNHLPLILVGLSILVCGLSCKESPQTPPETNSLPPIDTLAKIYVDSPFIPSDTNVEIAGAVYGTRDLELTIRVDYGHTSGYGLSMPPSQARSLTGVLIFSFTIDGLSPGTTYHWRLSVTSSRGVATTPDSVFMLPATLTPFDFPLLIGESWKYRFSARMYGTRDEVHTWRIVSTDGNGNWTFMQTRFDTSGTYIDSTSFIVRSFPDYFQIEFPDWQGLFEQSRRIPRFLDATKDTMSFFRHDYFGITGYERAAFVRGIGLVSYSGQQPHMLGTDAFLNLIEHRLHRVKAHSLGSGG